MARKLEKSRYFVTVHGTEGDSAKAAFMQDGVYFDATGEEITQMTPAAAPIKGVKPSTPAVNDQVAKQVGTA